MWKKTLTRWTQYWRDDHGNALMFVGLGMMMLVTAAGTGIDMGRAQILRSKLSTALDASGLAAGTVVHSEDVTSTVHEYFYANFPNAYMGSTLTSLTVNVNSNKTVIDLAATATLPTTLMGVFGMKEMTVSSTSQITRANKGMELVLVMDNTGSMASSSKISTMKNAAKKLINILYGDETELDNFWVSLVPYVTNVNIGADKFAWVKDYDPDRYTANWPHSTTRWKGCVEARSGGRDINDTPPNVSDPDTLWNIFFWEDHNVDNNWILSDGSVSLNESEGYSDAAGRGPNMGCGPEITPFTSKKSEIIDGINEMEPWRRGGTMSSVGLVWGWRVMSPLWRGLWAHESNLLPLDYEEPLMEKVVVILTDGENQFYDGSSADPPLSDYSPYGRLDDGIVGASTWDEGRRAINDRTEQICTAMKQKGIIIYTITFRLTSNNTAQTEARALFRNCATTPDYYYNSPDNETLDAVFTSIGDSLANLRISK